jgi:Protein of unknown function (DUF2934)
MAKRQTTPRTEAREVARATARPQAERRPDNSTVRDDRDAADEGVTSESPESGLSEDDIRIRAYHRYLERGGGHGMDFDDWLEAERELKSRQ